jgi:hypothetical protein
MVVKVVMEEERLVEKIQAKLIEVLLMPLGTLLKTLLLQVFQMKY